MKKILTVIASILCMAIVVPAQTYQATPVEVSKEKVRYHGEVYYSHIVKEKQTIFSICKAYNVTEKELFDANPTLHLDTEGLKKNQILLIPIKPLPEEAKTDETEEKQEEKAVEEKKTEKVQDEQKVETAIPQPSRDEYFFHTVKWYEDLNSIARKYNVSKLSIININGLQSQKVKRRQVLRIPRDYKKWENITISSQEEERKEPEVVEADTEVQEESLAEILSNPGNHEVHAAILMPFNISKTTDRQLVMDFYSGVLMAARDLGNEGMKIDVSAYDYDNGNLPSSIFSDNDFVLGPVVKADLARTARTSNGESWIISPADRMADSLADSVKNFIQAPTSINAQISDAVQWLKSDINDGDKVILIIQSGNTKGNGAYMTEAMSRSGISFSTITVSVLEAARLSEKLSGLLSENGTTRVITTSDSESFMNQIVKSLYILSVSGKDIALYTNAKIRTFNTIETRQLHGVNLHVSVASEVDYSSSQVQKFTIEYRSLFKAEPNHFSFQGYDLMRQFSTLVSKYGKKWHRAIDEVTMNGLQSDFNYVRNPGGGYSNTAARRVVYTPDYSIEIVK
jgi:LysM repeat protein